MVFKLFIIIFLIFTNVLYAMSEIGMLRLPMVFSGSTHNIGINPFLLKPTQGISIDGKTVVILMGGGDCAGLNDFIAHTVEKWATEGYKVIAVKAGFKGILQGNWKENLIELTPEIADRMRGLPSIATGSCREKLDPGNIDKIIDRIKDAAFIYFIGGNDHLKGVKMVDDRAKERGILLNIIGVPKSIDNDFNTKMLGFWSAVIAGRQIVRRVSIEDPKSRDENTARVFEVMGRKCGALTLRCSQACPYSRAVIVPERPVRIEDIINAYRKDVRNFFVSEDFSLSENDPRLPELLDAFPVLEAMWTKARTSPDRDVHGNPKLTGASLFVSGILKHFCNAKVESIDLTYQLRGAFLQPFDAFLARGFADLSNSILRKGKTGPGVVTYGGRDYEDTEGEFTVRPPEEVYKTIDLNSMMSDEEMAKLGVLGIREYPVVFRISPVRVPERHLSLKDAVRESFYAIAISTLAHRYASVVEFREAPRTIVDACSVEQSDIENLPYDLRTIIEATRESVLILIPGKSPISFREIANRIRDICNNVGYINIAISKGFPLAATDELLQEILGRDPVLKAKFREEAIDIGDGLVRFESGVSNFIVGLFQYLMREGEIKVEGRKVTNLGYAFSGLPGRDLASNAAIIGRDICRNGI